uniref:Uncharacterized protein n=1 Tax=virus sp. ctE0n6 TaxID=2827985 RepID=A0A8S5RGB5_9VIRU|nr:MAG TPA: hypothetical protein [virus sp. ctE0n6]
MPTEPPQQYYNIYANTYQYVIQLITIMCIYRNKLRVFIRKII